MTYHVICDECGVDLEFADPASAYGAARDHEAEHVHHTVRLDRPV
jgi:Fe2+ or Zn2+ uptake regulation protein